MRLLSQPSSKTFTIFHENLIAVERAKVELVLNKPIFVGFTILDVSKILIYDFLFGFIKQLYPGNKLQLFFTDTDSPTYAIKKKT